MSKKGSDEMHISHLVRSSGGICTVLTATTMQSRSSGGLHTLQLSMHELIS